MPEKKSRTGGSRSHPSGLQQIVRLPRPQRNFLITIFVLGGLLFLFNSTIFAQSAAVDRENFLVVLVMFWAVASTRGITLRKGDVLHEHKLWEYPLIVGVVISEPYTVAFAMGLVAIARCIFLYFYNPENRASLFMKFTLMNVVATATVYIAPIDPPYTYVLGYLLGIMLCELMFLGYDSSRGGSKFAMQNFVSGLAVRLTVWAFLSLAVTGMVFVLGPQPEFLLVLPLSLLLFLWLIQWRMEAVAQKAAWQHMESISSQFIGELEEATVVTIALREGVRLFSASKMEILLHGTGNEAPSKWSLTNAPGAQVSVSFLSPGESLEPTSGSQRSFILVLAEGDRRFGYIYVEWNDRNDTSTARDTLRATFGNAVASSIANTRHNKQISLQAAEKAREAERDPLTGLGNRTMLAEQGPALLAEAADSGNSCALMMFDLDGFKRINDTLGHAAGDEVLKEVAARIQKSLRRTDLAIRFGGDEFAVLATDLNFTSDIDALTAKINQALVRAIPVGDMKLSVESSIGVALYPQDAENVESLLKLADIAMYRAKSIGRGQTVRYSPTIDTNTTEMLSLTTDLRDAIYGDTQLVIHYQPQVELKTGRIVGLEALVRWNHPTLGLLFPDRFIHLAEQSGLIRPFTLTIVDLVLADREAMREVFPDSTVSINLSAQNLLDIGLVKDIKSKMRKHKVEPEELVLEVTESTAAKDTYAAARILNELRELGCKIAMDDFGSGYSTLESLRSGGGIDEIKIDRGFIQDIASNKRDSDVVHAIIEIAHAWDCRVVAEGVEDFATYQLLQESNCDIAQGYYMSRPQALDNILQWGVKWTSPDASAE